MSAGHNHIMIDEKGVARVAGTRTTVRQIAYERRFNHTTLEEMKQNWPQLSLEQIHAALLFYSEHQAEIDAAIDRAAELANKPPARSAKAVALEELEKRQEGW
jgi:uncharacterized protein (DUF433 family)